MATEILLPKLGLTMQEGTIEEWVATPGATIRPGDVLLRVGTDKVDVDVEAEAEGVFQPVVDAGVTLEPGTLIGWLLGDGEQIPGASGPEPRRFVSPNARRVASTLGVDVAAVRGTGPNGRVVSEDVEEFAAAERPAGPPVDVNRAGPLVRRYAKEHGVDLADVTGTGPGGRVRRADVEQVAAAPGTVLPLTGMRGTIAERMHASLREMAQLTHGYEVGMDAVVDLRERLKAEWAGTDLPVPSLNDFVVRAAALALTEHPLLNATIRDGAVHLLPDVHMGLAVAVPDGLLVPVIRDAATRSLTGLTAVTRELAGAARNGTLKLHQLEGATFVVTSLGSYGVDMFTPIVYPGNVAILGVGRLRDGVRWEGETPRRTRVLTLSLSFDHRGVDGAPAAEYLRSVDRLLQQPLRLLAN
ncbi:dihydrolipoamide acetyltransferase family protein [Actinophytocola sp.]|uniref:dihydrolipoamide acetyltransferase family protein n=1 Tax=Actinophytocola sp. TaxID=1872138 RepID=UPI002ED40E86